jgi:23S rRNA (adenine-N6)-dimethyltransferase
LPLPREPFRVVANLPFGSTTAILRRLFDDPRVPVTRADVVVEWDVARKRTSCRPSTLLGVCWSAWFELALVRVLPRRCFEPPPTVDASLLRVTRRARPLVPLAEHDAFCGFVRDAFENGVPRTRAAKQALREVGELPGVVPRNLDVHQWAALYERAGRRH